MHLSGFQRKETTRATYFDVEEPCPGPSRIVNWRFAALRAVSGLRNAAPELWRRTRACSGLCVGADDVTGSRRRCRGPADLFIASRGPADSVSRTPSLSLFFFSIVFVVRWVRAASSWNRSGRGSKAGQSKIGGWVDGCDTVVGLETR